MEVVLAKPQSDKKSDGAYSHISGGNPNHILHGGYGGYGGNPYGSLGGYGVTAGFHQVLSYLEGFNKEKNSTLISWICLHEQPVIYGRGPMPAGMQMVPMVLPDGRIGYVL